MTARAAAKVGPVEPKFDEHTAHLIASLASMPKKRAKRATAKPAAEGAFPEGARITARGVAETRRAGARTASKGGPRRPAG